MEHASPKIIAQRWGVVEVASPIEGLLTYKDVKLYPGGSAAWDWGETGTRHRPGIQPADVYDLLEHMPEVVILTRGVQLVLQVMPETVELLRSGGIEVEVLQTEDAVVAYNRMVAEGRRVGALIHSTC
ncbi:MAG: hypothetical protein ACI8RZ_004504 [Myxococcota bacterium]|jgi:hypothetical protein